MDLCGAYYPDRVEWGVYRLGGKRSERLPFTVAGRNAEEAIERAIKEYDVPPRERFRVSVQRET
jgi:hypothetical protein